MKDWTDLDPLEDGFNEKIKDDMLENAAFDDLLEPVLEKADSLKDDIAELVSRWVATYVSGAHLCLHLGEEGGSCGSVSYGTDGNLFSVFPMENLMKDALEGHGEDEFIAWLEQMNATAKELMAKANVLKSG